MTTTLVKVKEIKRNWHEMDASRITLGRLATEAARFLSGKHKPSYTPHLDGGDFVVITNIEKIKLTGRKLLQKEYFHYSGYPGGLKRRPIKNVIEKSPEKVIYRAVRGMLATNRLRAKRLKRLKLVKGTAHNFKIDKKI
ncbi:MAG: 50S ribosomal protein L13 [Candidatus Doudnabacteria bacterium RIFCSPHIGHO2_01_FULL_46_14]|uniref:Large ribosomal subunit protein uL13 n=1 Tax=Candidatus Doudnabacteria bacterium RIFCSPHIGHO2_01_FULL_46_14 TaxID=1817824 RepID=A0A1F5NP08_9BACT|nr:MAG: 50S ribosomal protein L13 [Candidatus Doudnabacteria bacterium RIFCSPHIGHO2_01_FULL_46_14]